MRKQKLAALCCGVLLLACGCGAVPAARPSEPTALETATVEGLDYYLLEDEAGLRAIGDTYPLSGNYLLEQDIVLTGQWIPIGTEAAPFTGVFDGNGHVIRGLHVTDSGGGTGFFLSCSGAVVKDVVLEEAEIDIPGFFPLVWEAEDTEITGCSINGAAQGADAWASGGEETAPVEALLSAGYEAMTLSDFRALVLDTFGDAAGLQAALEELSGVYEADTPEGRLVSLTLPATLAELTGGGASGRLERQRTAGRTLLDTVEFACSLSYEITYDSGSAVTVAERDGALEAVRSRMREALDAMPESLFSTAEAGPTLQQALQRAAEDCSLPGLGLAGTVTALTVMGPDGADQTVYPRS